MFTPIEARASISYVIKLSGQADQASWSTFQHSRYGLVFFTRPRLVMETGFYWDPASTGVNAVPSCFNGYYSILAPSVKTAASLTSSPPPGTTINGTTNIVCETCSLNISWRLSGACLSPDIQLSNSRVINITAERTGNNCSRSTLMIREANSCLDGAVLSCESGREEMLTFSLQFFSKWEICN